MSLSFILVIIQIALLSGVILFELNKGRGRNLVMITTAVALILFVEFQAMYVLKDLENFSTAFYYDNFINREGCSFAVLLLLLCTVVLLISHRITRRQKPPAIRKASSQVHQTLLSYIAITLILLATAYALIELSGGLGEALSAPARMIPGQTVYLIILQIGKIPLLQKVADRKKGNVFDFALFLISLLMILLSNRRMAMFEIWQYVVLVNYCKNEISRRKLVGIGVLVACIVLFTGTVRSFGFGYSAETPMRVYHLYSEGVGGQPFDLTDFFYRWNIEAFSGFGGIITAYLQHGISYDFGISYLRFFTHLTPYAIRTGAVRDFDDWLNEIYSYHGSVVSPGYEAAFGHFGFVGIFMLSVVLGVLPRWFHSRLTSPGFDKVLYALLSVHIVLLISADLWLAVFFALGDVMMLFLFRLVTATADAAVRRFQPSSMQLSRSVGR